MIDEMNELDEYERSLNSADSQYEQDEKVIFDRNRNLLCKGRHKPLLEG